MIKEINLKQKILWHCPFKFVELKIEGKLSNFCDDICIPFYHIIFGTILSPEAEFIDPWLGDKVNSCKGCRNGPQAM